MAKFKVGDRVRCIGDTMDCSAGWEKGREFEVDKVTCGKCYFARNGYGVWEDQLELIQTTYTKIEPKVGQKYRVLKKFGSNYIFGKDGGEATGHIIECTSGTSFKPVGFTFGNNRQDEQNIFLQEYLTSEYLELVEEETEKVNEQWLGKGEIEAEYGGTVLNTGQHVRFECVDIYDQRETVNRIADYQREYFIKPEIKQPISTKIMNRIKKALLSKEDKTLIEAGYLDDNLNLTCEGKEALQFINFTAAKKEMVAMAQADLDEQKKD